MENFGLLWKHIWPKLQFYEYDSLHRLLKLTKIFQTCSLSLFSRQRIIKLHTPSYGFCNFHIVTQPRQLDKRREEGATRACSTVTTELQNFAVRVVRVIKLPLLYVFFVSKKSRKRNESKCGVLGLFQFMN